MVTNSRMRIYDKISDERREELIRQVLLYKVQMKLAARQLRIKYPTAKYILKRYRDEDNSFPKPKALTLVGYSWPISRNLKSIQALFPNSPQDSTTSPTGYTSGQK